MQLEPVLICLLMSCRVALFSSLAWRMTGIALASFSSGLGEMTALQLSTSYSDPVEEVVDSKGDKSQAKLATQAVGWFSSGTGAAGLVGALLWWLVRGLGVLTGLMITLVSGSVH